MNPTVELRGLTVEHTADPVGIDVVPRFGWHVTGPAGTVQRRCRVRLRTADGQVWDSGTLERADGVDVEHTGPSLAPFTRHGWDVEVDVEHPGGAQTVRAGAEFTTGPLTDADWAPSAWIGRPEPAPGTVLPSSVVGTDVDVEDDLERALLVVAAGGYAHVEVDGVPVGEDVLSPGTTDYDVRVHFLVHDVTAVFGPGRHTVTAELGRGFFGPLARSTWDWERAPWHAEPCLRVLLVLHARDGSTRVVGTGADWWHEDGPTTYDDLYGGETRDATRGPGTGRVPATVVPGPRGRLEHQRQAPVRRAGSLHPVARSRTATGSTVLTFERVLAGWVRLRVDGPRGTRVSVGYGERLDADGHVEHADTLGHYDGRFQTDEFVLAGTGPEEFEPRFTWKGFQHVEVEGWPAAQGPVGDEVVALDVHADLPVTSTFSCSSPVLERLHAIALPTVLNNLQSFPTDTPMYERNGWTGDGMLGTHLFLLNLDVHEFLAKWAHDVADSAHGGPAPNVIAPHGGWHLDWSPTPPWDAACVLVPWWLHHHTGDERVLRAHYATAARYARFDLSRSADGIATSTLGDWMSPESDPGGGNPPEDPRVAATASLHLVLRTVAAWARELGNDADAVEFDAAATRVRRVFRAEFLTGSGDGLRVRGTGDAGFRQTHHLLAVAAGLVDEAEAAVLVAAVAADVRARGNHLWVGVLGAKHLLPLLSRHSEPALALAVAENPTYPGWGHWVALGATSLWEHWSPDARSRGHYFLGTFEDWLFADVAGLHVTAPAGRALEFRPTLTEVLDHASATVRLPLGTAGIAWRVEGARVVVRAEVPVGATGRLVLGDHDEVLPGSGVHERVVPLPGGGS